MKNTAFVLLSIQLQISPASAQELYDFSCCPNDDCQSAQNNAVTVTSDGYHVESLDIVIASDDPRIKASRDGNFHICTRSTATPNLSQSAIDALGNQRTVKCLYVPAMS